MNLININDDDIYLNNAATSWPKPDIVIKAITKCLIDLPGESGRSTDELTEDPVQESREITSKFFSCPDPDHLIFTSGATQSLNMLIHGFDAKTPGHYHVITTDLEHNSILRPLTMLENNKHISLSIVPSHDGYVTADEVHDAINTDTRLIIITHGSNVMGTVQPIHEIHKELNEDIFLIADGSQTAGQIPINIPSLGVDAYVLTGHKYLFGMPGIGGFWIRDPDRINPIMQGGTGTDSANLHQPSFLPERFEAGTPNYPGIVSLMTGIKYITDIGFDRISAHLKACTTAFYNAIKNSDQVIKYSPSPDIPVFPVNIKYLDADTAGFILRRSNGIITRTGLHCAPLIHKQITNGEGCIRLSPSVFTNPEDCRYAGETISDLAEKVKNATK